MCFFGTGLFQWGEATEETTKETTKETTEEKFGKRPPGQMAGSRIKT